MRVITGLARGRKLILPDGRDFRPTTDKVKESLFNIIQFDIEDKIVLDLFAGSGQLGIEALSRGAKKAVFVDSSKKSLDIVKQNISITKLDENADVVLSDASSYLKSCRDKFDIIFLDPPYHNNLCNSVAEYLSNVINYKSIIICETCSDEVLPQYIGDLPIDRCYLYSQIKLTVYRNCEQTEVNQWVL